MVDWSGTHDAVHVAVHGKADAGSARIEPSGSVAVTERGSGSTVFVNDAIAMASAPVEGYSVMGHEAVIVNVVIE